MRYIKPELKNLVSMMTMLLGDSANATASKSTDAADVGFTAVFVDASDATVAICTVDNATAAALGCSLSMIPPGGASDMASSGQLSEMAKDNLYEVMNVFSSLFMNDKSEHLKLKEVITGEIPEPLPGETEVTVFDIDVGNYGKGRLDFVSV